MEGGIAIFLLLLVIFIGIVVAAVMYLTGGAMRGSDAAASGDQAEDGERPVHKAPRSPELDHTHFVGTPEGDEAARRQRAARGQSD
jgi:hypothetical protein